MGSSVGLCRFAMVVVFTGCQSELGFLWELELMILVELNLASIVVCIAGDYRYANGQQIGSFVVFLTPPR